MCYPIKCLLIRSDGGQQQLSEPDRAEGGGGGSPVGGESWEEVGRWVITE